MRLLHLGCGRRGKDDFGPEVEQVITLDADPCLSPDIVCTLGRDPIPLPDDHVDAAVAMHVLEHIGKQGETTEWFYFWEELYRVLRPDGEIYFESPLWNSVWAWADPQHCRALSPPAFIYFNQDNYRLPDSRITPYRIRCDFSVVGTLQSRPDGNPGIAAEEPVSHFYGTLRARKPLKPWWED